MKIGSSNINVKKRTGARQDRTGQLEIVVVGTIVHESVFYFHPHVRRLPVVEERLDLVGTPESE